MSQIFSHKSLLNVFNFLFLLCGICLIISGFYLFSDTKRILLSRLLVATSDRLNQLPQPLFYYISLGLAAAGTVAVLAAIVGFWATCLNTYCCLSLYFLTVVVLLLAESVVCLAITLWPHCLGISLDESKMVRALQANYGVPGREQFTIAMDLAQTRFGCCGMNSDNNYDTGLWKLQGYGQREWTVPLSCCLLSNTNDKLCHLDPQPVNETQCQSLQKLDYAGFRYTESCLNHLDNWYREQYVTFLGSSLIVAIVEFCVLLSVVMSCSKLSGGSGRRMQRVDSLLQMRARAKSRQILVENIYEPETELNATTGNRPATATATVSDYREDFKETYIQPRDLYKQRYKTTFKPRTSDYKLPSTNYLV